MCVVAHVRVRPRVGAPACGCGLGVGVGVGAGVGVDVGVDLWQRMGGLALPVVVQLRCCSLVPDVCTVQIRHDQHSWLYTHTYVRTH